VDPVDGERRENELTSKAEFWAEMIKKGSTVMRHDQNEISVINIIQHILGEHRRMVLNIQEEMAVGKAWMKQLLIKNLKHS
jgi:hypothetical protein